MRQVVRKRYRQDTTGSFAPTPDGLRFAQGADDRAFINPLNARDGDNYTPRIQTQIGNYNLTFRSTAQIDREHVRRAGSHNWRQPANQATDQVLY